MNNKRSRSNAKANIWDTKIRSEDAVKYILTVSRLKKVDLGCFDDENEIEINKYLRIKRRNATHNIFKFNLLK